MPHSVLYDVAGHVATVTLNRPDVLNAGNRELLAGIQEAVELALGDDDVRSVVLTGAGRGFCAGADLAAGPWWPEGLTVGEGVGWILEHWWNPTAMMIRNSAKPTVAAVNGVAAGGGVGLALACDVVVAAESASFVQVFGPQLAVVPDVGSTWHLPRLVGLARARALAMLGDPLDAVTAAEWGLVWECVPDAELSGRARALASRLGALDPAVAAAIPRVLAEGLGASLADQLAREAEVNTELGNGPGFAEGVTAFLERRPPRFRDG